MARKLLVIHGYSDGSTSFTALAEHLVAKGPYAAKDVGYVEYASMDDDATFRDFADKLDTDVARTRKSGDELDVACHSTGALVLRSWLALHYRRSVARGETPSCPVRRILMFAPANFGSDLAAMGQSFLGKVRSTFFNSHSHGDDFLESGSQVLQGLEPASPFQWELSQIDLHGKGYFDPSLPVEQRCFPFVLAARESYTGLQAKLIKKRAMKGTDGTVRICGTGLNTRKCRIAFRDRKRAVAHWATEHKYAEIPFAAFAGFNHGSIIDPSQAGFSAPNGPGTLALEALAVQNDMDYAQLALRFRRAHVDNRKSYGRGSANGYKAEYQQFFFHVRDDVDEQVHDYYLDFYVLGANGKPHAELTQRFDEDFESSFTRHSADPAFRVMMLNCKKLDAFERRLRAKRARLVFDIEATAPLPDVHYQKGHFVMLDGRASAAKAGAAEPSFVFPNTTTLVEIVLNRVQDDKLTHLLDHRLHKRRRARTQAAGATGRGALLEGGKD